MTNTNTPPVYLLCFGELGRLVETVMPARLKQELHIVQFPTNAYKLKSGSEGYKETWTNSRNSLTEDDWHIAKQTESLMHRLLFSRKQPLVICVADPNHTYVLDQLNKNLGILRRAGLNTLGLFLDDNTIESAELPPSLANGCLGYAQIRLNGHAKDPHSYRRAAMACVKQIELLYDLAAYPDSEPSFLRMLPLLLKDCSQFVLASGYAEEDLSLAGGRLSSKLQKRLYEPVRGRSLVMVLSRKHHLGFYEISIVNSACANLLGKRMLIKAGGIGHPHLRMGQYLLIGMVSAKRKHAIG
jgi:hypothetical protein